MFSTKYWMSENMWRTCLYGVVITPLFCSWLGPSQVRICLRLTVIDLVVLQTCFTVEIILHTKPIFSHNIIKFLFDFSDNENKGSLNRERDRTCFCRIEHVQTHEIIYSQTYLQCIWISLIIEKSFVQKYMAFKIITNWLKTFITFNKFMSFDHIWPHLSVTMLLLWESV